MDFFPLGKLSMNTKKENLNRQQRRMLKACERKKQPINPAKLPTGNRSTYFIDSSIVVLEGDLL